MAPAARAPTNRSYPHSYRCNPGVPLIRRPTFLDLECMACVIKGLNICARIFVQKQVCEDENGTWYGPGGTEPVFSSCCEVQAYLKNQDPSTNVTILPTTQQTVRNDHYKLVSLTTPNCANGGEQVTQELYRIDQAVPLPKSDNAASNLLLKPRLNPDENANLVVTVVGFGFADPAWPKDRFVTSLIPAGDRR